MDAVVVWSGFSKTENRNLRLIEILNSGGTWVTVDQFRLYSKISIDVFSDNLSVKEMDYTIAVLGIGR